MNNVEENVQELGRVFGYNDCCVEFFFTTRSIGVVLNKDNPWFNTGFVPCLTCIKREVPAVLEEIKRKRKYVIPFPSTHLTLNTEMLNALEMVGLSRVQLHKADENDEQRKVQVAHNNRVMSLLQILVGRVSLPLNRLVTIAENVCAKYANLSEEDKTAISPGEYLHMYLEDDENGDKL